MKGKLAEQGTGESAAATGWGSPAWCGISASLRRSNSVLACQSRRTYRSTRRISSWGLPCTYRADGVQATSTGILAQSQQATFNAERQRWNDERLDSFVAPGARLHEAEADLPPAFVASRAKSLVRAALVNVGRARSEVVAGEVVANVESMKMKILTRIHQRGRLARVRPRLVKLSKAAISSSPLKKTL